MRRILVVDDDDLILEILEAVLGGESLRVETAAGGDEALARVGGEAAADGDLPDLVILDVMMPGTDGFAVCRAIKEDPATRHIPVVLLTARGGPEDRAAGQQAGCDAYITKPFSPRTLIQTLGGLGVEVPGG